MKSWIVYASLTVVFFASCAGYSKHPIDLNPLPVRKSLFGIWKAIEDTDKANFILVQADTDVFLNHQQILQHYGSISGYANMLNRDQVEQFGKHEINFDSAAVLRIIEGNKKNSVSNKNYYYFSYLNRGGKNCSYCQWHGYSSLVDSSHFLNLRYQTDEEDGYVFVKLFESNLDTIIAMIVTDPTMRDFQASSHVKRKIENNLGNRFFYSDTFHFYKVRSGHFSIKEARKIANE